MVNINPIRTGADYEAALAEIDSLVDAENGTPEGDRLDVLTAVIHAYEQRHHRIEYSDPIDVVLFMLEQRGMTRADLVEIIGGRGRVSEILNKKRPLTLDMIRRLSKELHIPASLLVGEYELSRKAS